MNTNYTKIYAKLQKLDNRWAYTETKEYLVTLPDEIKRVPSVALQIGRIYLSQGMVRLADQAFAQADANQATAGEKLILALERCSLRFYVSGQIEDVLVEADNLWNSRPQSSVDAVDQLIAERLLSKIIINAGKMQEVTSGRMSETAERLPLITQSLLQSGCVDDAMFASILWFENFAAGPFGQPFLDQIVYLSQGLERQSFAGRALLKQAETLWNAQSNRNDINALINKAAEMFKVAENESGIVDVQTLLEKIAVSESRKHLDGLNRLLEKYQQIEYANGEMVLLLDLAQIALEKGLYDESANYREKIATLSDKTGLGLMRVICELRTIDNYIRSSRYREAIEFAEASLERKPARYFENSFIQLIESAKRLVNDSLGSKQ